MASYLTSTTLIESIGRRGSVPASQGTFKDDDFLAFANEEMSIGLLPLIMQFHEEFLVYTEELPLVAGQQAYSIPSRAIGSKLRTVHFKDDSGNKREMARIEPENVVAYSGYNSNRYTEFYLENNSIVLVAPVTSSSGAIVVGYYMRPNKLVTEDRVAVIKNITDTTVGGEAAKVLVVDKLPSVFTVSAACDLVGVKGTHKTKKADIYPLAINGASNPKTMTFRASDVPSNLAVGDHVNLQGECIIPQIPDELHVILAQRVICRCLEALGDQQGLASATVKLQEMEASVGSLIDNRTEGNPQKAVNLRGLLRGARLNRRRMF